MNFKNPRDFLINIQKTKVNNVIDKSILDKILEDRKNVLNLNILILLDVSGSISSSQYKQFMAQIDSIKGLSRVKVIEVDTDIVAMYDYFNMPSQRIIRLRGGGGTNFYTAFRKIKSMNPDAVLAMTDGEVSGSAENPLCPVGWILTKNGTKPYDFGEVLMNLE